MKHVTSSCIALALLGFLSCQGIKAQSLHHEPIVLSSNKPSTLMEVDKAEAESTVRFSVNRKKNHVLTIESSRKGKMTIVDESDRILYQQALQEGINEIKLQSLESGKYRVKVKDDKGKLYRTKLTYVKVD